METGCKSFAGQTVIWELNLFVRVGQLKEIGKANKAIAEYRSFPNYKLDDLYYYSLAVCAFKPAVLCFTKASKVGLKQSFTPFFFFLVHYTVL